MTKEWDRVKPQLEQLYLVERKTLAEVMNLMKTKYNFVASKRAYKNQFEKWGPQWQKNRRGTGVRKSTASSNAAPSLSEPRPVHPRATSQALTETESVSSQGVSSPRTSATSPPIKQESLPPHALPPTSLPFDSQPPIHPQTISPELYIPLPSHIKYPDPDDDVPTIPRASPITTFDLSGHVNIPAWLRSPPPSPGSASFISSEQDFEHFEQAWRYYQASSQTSISGFDDRLEANEVDEEFLLADRKEEHEDALRELKLLRSRSGGNEQDPEYSRYATYMLDVLMGKRTMEVKRGRAVEAPTLNQGFDLTSEEMMLIHHASTIETQMKKVEPDRMKIFTAKVPELATSYRFVLESVLSLSATHLAWVSGDWSHLGTAFKHREIAFKGLQKAIEEFSKENSDAVLAATIVLSWQVPDAESWSTYMVGSAAVARAMIPWKEDSYFHDIIANASKLANISALSVPNPQRDMAIFTNTLTSLRRVIAFVNHDPESLEIVSEMISTVENLQLNYPREMDPQEQFNTFHPLHSRRFRVSAKMQTRYQHDAVVQMAMAYYYATCLAVEPLFPAIGPGYIGSLCLDVLAEIGERLERFWSDPEEGAIREALLPRWLMNWPLQLASEFRARDMTKTLGMVSLAGDPRSPI